MGDETVFQRYGTETQGVAGQLVAKVLQCATPLQQAGGQVTATTATLPHVTAGAGQDDTGCTRVRDPSQAKPATRGAGVPTPRRLARLVQRLALFSRLFLSGPVRGHARGVVSPVG